MIRSWLQYPTRRPALRTPQQADYAAPPAPAPSRRRSRTTTKQAASKLVEAMVAGGYLQRETDPQDGRQRPVHLTPRGEELLRAVEQIYAELEQEWAQMIGASHVQRMRRDLVYVLSDANDGELPPVRPSW